MLRRRRWLVVLLGLVGALAGVSSVLLRAPTYTSSATILVRPVTTATPDRFVPIDQQLSMETELQIASSAAVARLAGDSLEDPRPPAELLRLVTVENPPDTQIMTLHFSAPNPEEARDGAQAFAEAYLEYKRRQGQEANAAILEGIRDQMVELEAELRDVEGELQATAAGARARELRSIRDTLIGQLAILRGRLVSVPPEADPGEIIAPAETPGGASSPRPAMEIVIGALLGLVAGLVLAFVRDRMDDRVRSPDELERIMGVRVLGALPRARGRHSASRELVLATRPDSGAAEAYRAFAATLLVRIEGGKEKSFLIAGATTEPAAATAANLAVALANAGKKVALVGADLRGARLHALFGIANGIGLADILEDAKPLTKVVQATKVDRLRVVTSGTSSTSPVELLQSARMRDLLDELATVAEVILVETRPVLVGAEALALARLFDGTILVCDTRQTTRRGLLRAKRELQDTADIAGTVLHNAGD